MHSVVVTGMGLVSCLGHALNDVRDALEAGRSGLVHAPEREALGFHCTVTGYIRDLDPSAHLTRKERRAMGEPAIYAAIAALRALKDGGLPRDALASADCGVIVGNDTAADATRTVVDEVRARCTTRSLGSGAVVRAMTSSPAINLAALLGIQGAAWTVAGACAAGAHALGQAYGLIATGQQDMVVAGGTQEINWAGSCAFDGLGAFSRWKGDPAKACRPFDTCRDGLVPSGGAAILLLERKDLAIARGARIRGELLAYAFSCDGGHVTTPSGDGAVRCMRRALVQAGLSAEEIEYVSAHATGTPVGDAVEARAIREVFGTGHPPVSSTKGLTGHECWMAGASEIVYSLLMAEGGFLAGNHNLEQPDPAAEDLDLLRRARRVRARTILSNSFGFGGTNASLIIRANEDP